MAMYSITKNIAAGETVTADHAMLPTASRHTVQVEGDGPVTITGRMAGAAAFAEIQANMAAGIYTDLVAHRLDAFELTNSGSSAVTVHIAGGE